MSQTSPQNFSYRNLRGRNFSGQDLTGTDFRYADIRGANFTSANLTFTNFTGVKAGILLRWRIGTVVALLLVSVLSGLASAISLEASSKLSLLFETEVTTIAWIGAGTISILSAFVIATAIASIKILTNTVVTLVLTILVFVVALPKFPFIVIPAILGSYLSLIALRNDKKWMPIRKISILLSSAGGTSFQKADLSYANFFEADIGNTDFRQASVFNTGWFQSKNLALSVVGNSYLQNPQIRQLVITGKGQRQNFDTLDLKGINLRGADLESASFIAANLCGVNLQCANLYGAKLKQTQLDGADLTGATLTGAYIEDWGVTAETKLDEIRCEYVYMHVPTKEKPDPIRKPSHWDEVFVEGDFADFIRPLTDTLDLYHNQKVDPRAIAIALKNLAENHPDSGLEIVALEVKGEGKFLLRAKSSLAADKSELSAEYFSTYNMIRNLSKAQVEALLVEKESRIQSLEAMVKTALERPSFYNIGTIGIGNVEGGMSVGTNRSLNIETIGNVEGGISVGTNQNLGIGNVDYANNISMQNDIGNIGNISGDVSNIHISGDVENIGSIEKADEINRNIKVEVLQGGGMLVGKPTELGLQITNTSSKKLDINIEVADSAEYEILTGNPVYIPELMPQNSVSTSFSFKMKVSREIPINYKINGKLSRTALYVNAIYDNPYTYGNPVGNESTFFGRQKELDQILQAITKSAKQDILVVGERRTGKTSLLNQVKKRIGKPFIPVYVVINTSEEPTAKSILGLIFDKIAQGLIEQNLVDKREYQRSNFPALDFVENIRIILEEAKSRLPNVRIVLMLDEADSLLEVKHEQLEEVDARPQNILRAALQSAEVGKDLRAILAATNDLATHMSTHSSPLFNHFRNVPLKPLSIEETKLLINNPAEMLDYSYIDSAVAKIVSLSGGQPYYCQALCYEAFNQALQSNRSLISDDDVLHAEEMVISNLYTGYLTGFWQRLSDSEKSILKILSVKRFLEIENRPQLRRLLDWQIVVESGDVYTFSSGLIERWSAMAIGESTTINEK